MPSITLKKDLLFSALDLHMNDEDFAEMLFDFGLELDEILHEDNITSYKIDIPANRYDLLCLEGMVMALRSYKLCEEYEEPVESVFKARSVGCKKTADYKFNAYDIDLMQQNTNSVIHQNGKYRKFIACAIIKGINFDQNMYDSFIEYQDKLHLSIGRNRSIVAIGTHNTDKIQFPVFYKNLKKEEIKFQPLNQDRCMTGDEIFDLYGKDTKMKQYCKLFPDEYPCFIDANGNVLSLPPLINSDNSKIAPDTQDIFVEVTGTDEHKVNVVLKMILYNFRGKSFSKINILRDYEASERKCIDICQCEGINNYTTPVFMDKTYKLSLMQVNKDLGLNLNQDELYKILIRMMHSVVIHGNEIIVRPSDVRSDVIHYVDLLEDIAIAYGYNNFTRTQPNLCVVGLEDPFIKFCDRVRSEMARACYNELLTLSLLSKSQNINKEKFVSLTNPKSSECEVVRNSLLPGVLKAIHANQHVGGTIKVFEVSDVVIINSEDEPENKKNLCVCFASKTDGLDNVLGLCFLLVSKLGMSVQYRERGFDLYFKKRSAEILIDGVVVGTVGVINPVVCNEFRIPFAISSAEINLDSLFRIYQ